MLPEEREYVRRVIASILDYPSVYMGGPSQNNLRRAGSVIEALEQSGRLVPTMCTHDEYDEARHGIACPTCGMHMTRSPEPEFLFKPAQE